MRDFKLSSLYGCFKCWKCQPRRSFAGRLIPSCCHMWGTGRGEEEVAITSPRSWSRSEEKPGLLSLALGSSQVLSSLSWSPCTSLATQKPSHINSFGGLASTKAAAKLLSRFSRVRLCVTPYMAAHKAPLSLGFSREEHWSGLPVPSPMHESEVAQSCPTLCDPMDCSPPGSPVHGIFQARVLEWGAIAFSGCFSGDRFCAVRG